MYTAIQVVIVLAVIWFAIVKVNPYDGALKKLSVVVMGSVAAFWDTVWPMLQFIWNGLGL